MKFFGKNPESEILMENLTYQENRSENNRRIKEILIQEQHNFCAYTEKYFDPLDSVEVEHFDSSIKYIDNYFNYYAVLRKPNLYKKDEAYKNAPFFASRFFQDSQALNLRIRYAAGDYVFEEVDEEDEEAKDFIDFLGLNYHDLVEARKRHVNRLADIFRTSGFLEPEILEYFHRNQSELSFITVLENELQINLSAFYT